MGTSYIPYLKQKQDSGPSSIITLLPNDDLHETSYESQVTTATHELHNSQYFINNTNMAAMQTSELRMKLAQISVESRYNVLYLTIKL
jgi:hypothetical protein